MFLKIIIGITENKAINNDGIAARPSLSSEANEYAVTAKVLKSRGLSTNVAGNSFITSIKISAPPINEALNKRLICKRLKIFLGDKPNV